MSTNAGLTSDEASRRLAEFGDNDPAPRKRRSVVFELVGLFANPLVIILLVAAAASAALNDVADATIVVVIVAASIIINFTQTFRSQRAAEQLRLKVAPTATVLRDGTFRELLRREVVPGDVVRLSAGDLVPADAKLLEAKDLYTQEAALTGESMPVEKQPGTESTPTWVLLGTSVVSGTALAEVVRTGKSTMFGDVAKRLAARPPETEFERGMKRFGFLIMRAVFFLVLFILVVNIALHRNAMESLLFAIALAVGLTPEFLPMITSVTLAQGAVAMAREKVIVKHLAAIQNLGSVDVLCSDKTGTLTSGKMSLDASVDALGAPDDRPWELGALNAKFETGIRSPLDTAILERSQGKKADAVKCDEVPFDFVRRRLSVVVEEGGVRTLITKGAPEGIIALSSQYEAGGQTRALTDADRKRITETFEGLSKSGFRVLAVARREIEKRLAYDAKDERDLVLMGFLSFADPPREDAAETIRALRRDGVRVKVLTGDNELVTRHVCSAVGLNVDHLAVGSEIEKMTDAALEHVVERTSVFARVSPAQKNRIMLALKRRSHVVGFLGDGINDAPSLHTSDVGISVFGAVDVAREAADIILLECSLSVLHTGILQGRRAFGNVTKYLRMGTSSNFGNMLSMAGAALVLPFLPMLPTQILLNNLLYDLSQITIPTDNVDAEYLQKPQRWDIGFVRNVMLVLGPVSSLYDFLTFYVLLHVFHASERLFHTGWFVESLATQTLVIFVIRTMRNPLRSRPSTALIVTTLTIVAVGCALPFSPLAAWLGFEPLPLKFFGFLAGATLTYLALVEVAKRVLARHTHGMHKGEAIASHLHDGHKLVGNVDGSDVAHTP